MPKGIHKMLKKIFNLTMLVFAVPVFFKNQYLYPFKVAIQFGEELYFV